MKKTLLFLFAALISFSVFAKEIAPANPYSNFFSEAYQLNPNIPEGTLEAIAFNITHFQHLKSNEEESCSGMPKMFGVMGLTLDGKGYFRNNLNLVAEHSGYTVEEIINDPRINILAFAKAYSSILNEKGINTNEISDHIPALVSLSELPAADLHQNFALSTYLYGVLSFLNDPVYQQTYHLPAYQIDLKKVFGAANYSVLSANYITMGSENIRDKSGNTFDPNNDLATMSTDYGPALWNPTSCNFDTYRGAAISAVTIHTMQGYYAGAISWFKNCSARASAHYLVRSSDGQVTQMVREAHNAWHARSASSYSVGIEHEGFVSDASWYTTALYNASAALTRDIVSSHNINPLRAHFGKSSATVETLGACVKIKGHQHFPDQSHTDPGINWDWERYYKLINGNAAPTIYSASSGTFYDTGGPNGNYKDDERKSYLISPSGATSVTLSFSSFNLENNWDFLLIYDGANNAAPLIGKYTGTTSPGTIKSTGGSLYVEFRSDCGTTSSGWAANWGSGQGGVNLPKNLNVKAPTCNDPTFEFSWENKGNGWWLDIGTDPGFALGTFHNKEVTNVTSTKGPGGFLNYPGWTSPLTLQPKTTYYWRIFNGSSHVNGAAFTTPECINIPENLKVTAPDCNNPFATFEWKNSGQGWWLDIGTDPNFALGTAYNKSIDNLTKVGGPTGFMDYPGGTKELTFKANTVYYWRIFDGSKHYTGNSFTIPFCNEDPKGFVDVIDCDLVKGWAYDPNNSSSSIDVHIYIDGNHAATAKADQDRSDVNAAFGITGKHGFNWILPSNYKDGKTHNVVVYAINTPSGNNPFIGGKTLGPCSSAPAAPENLSVIAPDCGNPNAQLSWDNTGNGWWLDIGTDPNFTLGTFYNKNVSNLKSIIAPAGFKEYPGGNGILAFQPGATYYWRVFNGSKHVSGGSFIVPICNGTDPLNLTVNSPTCSNPNAQFSWTNSGANWRLHVSADPNFSGYATAYVYNISSSAGPSGVNYTSGITYYWRIWDGSSYTYGPSFSRPSCIMAPDGGISTANCNEISGWSFDPDESSVSNNVDVIVDGNYYSNLPTKIYRNDINQNNNIIGDHGFEFVIPQQFLDGKAHLFEFFASDIPGGNNKKIGEYENNTCVLSSIPENNKNDGFKLSPNPSSDLINISYTLTQSDQVEIQLINLLGEVIILHAKNMAEGTHQLSVNAKDYHLAKGLYFIRLNQGNTSRVERLIIQ